MSRIEPEFEKIRDRGVSLVTFNKDALNADVRSEILDGLAEALGTDGKIRVVLHSIAFGNLKLIGPEAPVNDTARQRLAEELGIDEAVLREAADQLFAEGCDGVQGLTTPPSTPPTRFWKKRTWPGPSTRWGPAFSVGPKPSGSEACSRRTRGYWA